jgi:hypothetical protein
MRIIFIPDTPEFWLIAAAVLALIIVIAVYRWLRPPAAERLIADPRYRQALEVYAGNLQHEDPTYDDRQAALAVAADYLAAEHGVPAEEAEANLRLVAAVYDRERSYELRHEAIAYEQAGAYDQALDYYERAARWREGHDAEDYQFLQRCAARVRGKVRPW